MPFTGPANRGGKRAGQWVEQLRHPEDRLAEAEREWCDHDPAKDPPMSRREVAAYWEVSYDTFCRRTSGIRHGNAKRRNPVVLSEDSEAALLDWCGARRKTGEGYNSQQVAMIANDLLQTYGERNSNGTGSSRGGTSRPTPRTTPQVDKRWAERFLRKHAAVLREQQPSPPPPPPLRRLGFIGGMTPQSTAIYYSQINRFVNSRRGGFASAPLVLHSVDYAAVHKLWTDQDWDGVAAIFSSAASSMKQAGCGAVAIGCNIGHKVAGQVEEAVGLPMLHIADATAAALAADGRGLRDVGLLATLPVMEEGYIVDRIRAETEQRWASAYQPIERLPPNESVNEPEGRGGSGNMGGGGVGVGFGVVPEPQGLPRLRVLVPDTAGERLSVSLAISRELALGIVTTETRDLMRRAVEGLVARGAQAVVLACTDLQMVIRQEDVGVPLFDTLELHARALADWICSYE